MPANLLDEPEIGAEQPQKDYHWTLNFGPQHPATHTTLRLILELDGERIVKATPDIGYLHSGFEKLGEHLNFNQYVTIVDRKNYISPPMNEVAWHHAVEKLLDIEITKRCQYIRVIIGELARISDHLLCVGAAALDLGAFTAFLFCFNQRELIYDVYEEMSGYRFHPGYTRVGGVLQDFNDAVIKRIRTVLERLPKALADTEKLVLRNRIFLDRVRGVGVLTKEDAIAFCCTGPVARASGVATTSARTSRIWLILTLTSRFPSPPKAIATPGSRSGSKRSIRACRSSGRRSKTCPPARSTCRSPRSSRFPTRGRLTTAWKA